MTCSNSEARKKEEEQKRKEKVNEFAKALGGDATPVSGPLEALRIYQNNQRDIIRQNRKNS